jgi:hypothetical protein
LARRGLGRHHHHGDAVEQWAHLDEPGRDEWQRPQLVVAAAGITDGQVVADGRRRCVFRHAAGVAPCARRNMRMKWGSA